MSAYVVRRVISMIILLLLLTLVVFILFSLLPADPARLTCGKGCTPAVLEANRHKLGLDLPVIQQYWEFMKGLFVGRIYAADSPDPVVCNAPCLGYSFKRGEEVLVLIKDRLPALVLLGVDGDLLYRDSAATLAVSVLCVAV